MQTEPIRLPAWIATLLVVVAIPVAVAFLTDLPVKPALAVALSALAPLIVASEVSRRRVDSPVTVARKVKDAKARAK